MQQKYFDIRGHLEANIWPLRGNDPKLILFRKSLAKYLYFDIHEANFQYVAYGRSLSKTIAIFEILDQKSLYFDILEGYYVYSSLDNSPLTTSPSVTSPQLH